jgi:predicted nucleic acid-binding protein
VADLYVLDTNVYIDALRDREERAALKRFLIRVGLRIRLAGIVAMELRAGAVTPEHQRALEQLIDPHVRRERVIGLSFAACLEAGRALSSLVAKERLRLASAPASLTNDALMAAWCREAGAVLVTNNHRDFTRLARHLRGFRFVAPWPSAPAVSKMLP